MFDKQGKIIDCFSLFINLLKTSIPVHQIVFITTVWTPMNSQSSSIGNPANQYLNSDPMHRFQGQPPVNGVYDPNVAMLLHSEMQMMLKWRTQMAHMLRTQPHLFNNYPFSDPNMPTHLLPPLPRGNQSQYWERYNKTQSNAFPNGYRFNEMMPPYPPFMMRGHIPETHQRNQQRNRYNPSISQNSMIGGTTIRKKPLQGQKEFFGNQNKEREIIVIDEDDEEQVVTNKLKIEKPKPVQKPLPQPIETNMKVTRSRELIAPKKNNASQNVHQRRVHKTSHLKQTVNQKVQEDSFKPSNNRIKRIKKAKIEVERQKLRHAQTDREKALREKKLNFEEKNQQTKLIQNQAAINVSGFHQASNPQFRFGKEEYNQYKQSKKQNLLSRLQFQGSCLQGEYQKLKQVVPNWPVISLINVVKQKFGNLPLSQKMHLVSSETDEKSH